MNIDLSQQDPDAQMIAGKEVLKTLHILGGFGSGGIRTVAEQES